MNKKDKKNKVFTLVELLVVVAILGILTGVVVVSVGDAVARARDSRRLADVRQLASTLELDNATFGPASTTGCAGPNASTTGCAIPNRPNINALFSRVIDPSGAATPCTSTNVACQYSISREGGAANPSTNDYRICFRLETDPDGVGGPLQAGMNRIVTGARFIATCP